jgi:hypothetical protein
MEWGMVWRTIFCGWDGDVDLAALARELADVRDQVGVVEDRDAAGWVCRQIQEAY